MPACAAASIVLLLLLPLAQSAPTPIQSSSIAVEGVLDGTTGSVWAAWSSTGASGKPQIDAESAFAISVWAYNKSSPDPLSGDVSQTATKLFSGPAALRASTVRSGFDVAVASAAGRHAITTDGVLLGVPQGGPTSTRAPAPPFPAAPSATHLGWSPASAATLDLQGDIQIRLWETDLEITRPGGVKALFTSGVRTDSMGHPDGSSELLVTIEGGTAHIYSTSQSFQGLYTGPLKATVEGRVALRDGVWSDAADGLAPFTDELAIEVQRVQNVLAGQILAHGDAPDGPGIVTKVIDPAPATIVEERDTPRWLWVATIGSLLVAGIIGALLLLRVRGDFRLQQLHAATAAGEHGLALHHAQRLLWTRHAAEASASVVQATLAVHGPQEALQALARPRVRRFLDPALMHVLAASIWDELDDPTSALQALDDACAIDPSLQDLFRVDVGGVAG